LADFDKKVGVGIETSDKEVEEVVTKLFAERE
jgi:hypothetical protein